jgi:DNA-binding NtrC family response regulator
MAQTRVLNLVLLDDDAAITRLAQRYLESEFIGRMNLRVFNDSRAAKSVIDELGCDILVSDIQMPDINGLDLLRYAKQRNHWTQVIFMTAHSTWDCIAEAIENGASDYLLKPLDGDELIRIVEETRQRVMRWQQAVRTTWQIPASASV